MTNSLGTFVLEQMRLLGWSRETLMQRTALDEWTLEAILDSPVLPEWPEPRAMAALARELNLPVRELVLQAAQGCGLDVLAPLSPTETLMLASNEDLMREVRRRLALGARTGQYIASPSGLLGADVESA
ncbi:hypothetical protein RKE38_07080 [Phycicoccus sp. M110.8]|uniref:hypothetical protein n=1 Tax=Phycicoccus sp. M110.8 TaxID=3075433 RepID=UPI0028FDA4E6|nr:hypothetical protein [Phycicoccus sp. M110.8]MDU0313444.1 hypothetical protein [Phycicoccus sp. M110.8]